MKLYERIANDIIGRIAITQEEAGILAKIIKTIPSQQFYVEVGTLWGGTAILAALANPEIRVMTLDRMKGGFWNNGDPVVRGTPTPGAVLDNLARFRVANRVSVHKGEAHPWPYPNMKPHTFFIDGDHSFGGCLADWIVAKEITQRYVIFHDCAETHPDVLSMVHTHVITDDEWRACDAKGSLYIVERKE